jgi:FixJ family two-component response regulator
MELTTVLRTRKPDQIGMEKDRKTIAIIDDDNSIRQALKRVLNTAGFRVHMYASAEDFLAAIDNCDAGCAVVDLEPGTMSGFELACHPAMVAAKLRIIFISGTKDETGALTRVSASLQPA